MKSLRRRQDFQDEEDLHDLYTPRLIFFIKIGCLLRKNSENLAKILLILLAPQASPKFFTHVKAMRAARAFLCWPPLNYFARKAPIMSDYPTPSLPTAKASNLYQSPPTQPQYAEQQAEVSAMIINQLVRTRGWVRLCSIIGFIGSAFMVVGGIFMLIGGAAMSTTMAKNPATSMYGTGMIAGMGIFYLLFALLYIYPSMRLWQYASSITQLQNSEQIIDLETALNKQRSFWKFVGLMITIILGLYLLIFLAAIVIGAAGAIGG
jgi:hypothetical protein